MIKLEQLNELKTQVSNLIKEQKAYDRLKTKDTSNMTNKASKNLAVDLEYKAVHIRKMEDALHKTIVDLGLAEAWDIENYERTTINYGHIESPYTPPKPNKLNQLNELNEKEFLKGL